MADQAGQGGPGTTPPNGGPSTVTLDEGTIAALVKALIEAPQFKDGINASINGALANRLGRKSIEQRVEEVLNAKLAPESLGKSIEGVLEQWVADAPPAEAKPTPSGAPAAGAKPTEGNGNGNGAGAVDAATLERIAALQKQIEEQGKQYQKLARDREAEKRAAEKAQQDALLAAKSSRIDAAVQQQAALLARGNPVVARMIARELREGLDEVAGQIVFKTSEPDGYGQVVEKAIPFAERAEAWAKTDGKMVIPAHIPSLPTTAAGYPMDSQLAFYRPPAPQAPQQSGLLAAMKRDIGNPNLAPAPAPAPTGTASGQPPGR